MFKYIVLLVHGLLFLSVILLGIGPMFSIAPDPDRDPIIDLAWASMIVIFIILVSVSFYVQLRINKVWVFLISVIGLIAFFILTLAYIYPFVLDLFLG